MLTVQNIIELAAAAANNQPIQREDTDRIADAILPEQPPIKPLTYAIILHTRRYKDLPETKVYNQGMMTHTEDWTCSIVWTVTQRQLIIAANAAQAAE